MPLDESWLREIVAFAHNYRGAVASMVAAIENPDSALHAPCVTMKTAGARRLTRAQAAGVARTDIDGADLFALVGALAWLHDRPSVAPRADHLFAVLASALLTNRVRADSSSNRQRMGLCRLPPRRSIYPVLGVLRWERARDFAAIAAPGEVYPDAPSGCRTHNLWLRRPQIKRADCAGKKGRSPANKRPSV